MMHLIVTVLIIGCVTIFAGFNLNNKCDINFVFRTFNDIPVFATIVLSFLAGVLVTLPYVFVKRHKRKAKTLAEDAAAVPAGTDRKKKTPFFLKEKKEKKTCEQAEAEALPGTEEAEKGGAGETDNTNME